VRKPSSRSRVANSSPIEGTIAVPPNLETAMKKLALILVLMAPLASAQDWMATSFDHTEVTPGIYMLTGADGQMPVGATGLLVGDEYVVLIDDSFAPLGPAA
jgi:hypothetical protein